MAIIPLTDPGSYANFFQRRILINLQYWRDNAAIKTTDVAALDQERSTLIRAISFALDVDEAWPLTGELIVALAPYMERRGYWETWRQLLNRAVEIARQVGDGHGAVQILLLLARLLQREGRLRPAAARYREVIGLARRLADAYNEARACSNLGFLYIDLGFGWRAEVLCHYALKMFEQLDSDHGRAHTENHLGILHLRQGQWQQARQHLERACAIWQEMGDDHGLMRGQLNLGLLYNEIGSPEKALPYLKKALRRAESTGEEAEIGYIYMNIGIAHRLNHEPDEAERYNYKAETVFRRFSNRAGLALVWINLGEVYIDQKEWGKAEAYLEKALTACRRQKNSYGEIQALRSMVEYELARGNPDRATRRLKELEKLVQPHDWPVEDRHLKSLLEKYPDIEAAGVKRAFEARNGTRPKPRRPE